MDATLVNTYHIPLLIKYFKRSKVKWFDAGLKFGLDQDTLEAIEKSHRSDVECFKAMLKQLVKDSKQPTMGEVWKVLKGSEENKWFTSIEKLSSVLSSVCEARAAVCDPTDFSDLYHVAVSAQHQTIEVPVYTELPADERQQLIVSLQEQTLAIRKEFEKLVTATMEEYKKSHLPLHFLIGFMESKNPKGSLFDQDTSIEDVFSVATAKGFWSFFEYNNLKFIQSIAGQEILYSEREYETHFGEYCKRRLRKFPSDGAAVEEKVVFLMDNKMGLQRSAELELRQLQSQVSEVTGFRVSKLVWIEDDWQEPTLGAELSDKGEGVEESCSARELDSAPTLPQPKEPCPPLQRYLPDNKKKDD